MLVRVDKIIVNLAHVLTASFKDDKTLYIAYNDKSYWEHEYLTPEEAEEAYEELCKHIEFYEKIVR